METNIILQGDALTKLRELPSESIDCIMTSPPYWALRDYGVEGQLGLEPTFEEYIKKLCDIFDECKRVLKKTGTCWVNMGDTYMGNSSYSNEGRAGFEEKTRMMNKKQWLDPKYPHKEKLRAREWVRPIGTGKCLICDKEIPPNREFCSRECLNKKGNDFRSQNRLLPNKSLCMIPFRFAIEMVNRGWILRNDIVWYKRNAMPTSVKDRLGNRWEHIFFFVKSKQYYFNLDSIRKPYAEVSLQRMGYAKTDSASFNYRVREARKGTLRAKFGEMYNAHPDEIENYGKGMAMPQKWNNPKGGNPGDFFDVTTKSHPFAHFAVYPEQLCETPIKAGCPLGGIVLDPFFGSGTTGLVSLKQNKRFIGIELNPEYIKIANERLKPYLEQEKLIL
jgi:DNA modification methylase